MGNRSSSEDEGGSWLRTLKNSTSTSTQDRKRLWDIQLTWDERLILWILNKGVVPRHVALVPDGNRRYAKLNELELHSAYDVMFEKTTLMCQYMVKLGVEDISYGILSIRNFYRDASEVNAVLSAMANFYRTALCNTNSLQRINLLVSTIGDMNMHPEELQSDMAQVEIVTANEGWTRKCRLFSAYTSRSELTKVIVHMTNAVVKERHQKTFSSSHDMDPHKIFRQRMFLRSLKLWRRRNIEELLSLKCTQKKKKTVVPRMIREIFKNQFCS
nr:dehydrodolichyl diphosphate synthase complex subunit DHDDS-like isoform X2 [Rhipicephalus microplus]